MVWICRWGVAGVDVVDERIQEELYGFDRP